MTQYLIESNNVMFYSTEPQSFFERKRKNRLEKKLSVGKHLSLVLMLDIHHTIKDDKAIDAVIDDFFDMEIERRVALSFWSEQETSIAFQLDNSTNVNGEVDREVEHIVDEVQNLFERHNTVAGIEEKLIHGI